jgi:hypothetical protein
MTQFMFFPKPYICLEIGSPLQRDEGLSFVLMGTIHVCHFAIMNHFYEKYTEDNSQCRLLQHIMP